MNKKECFIVFDFKKNRIRISKEALYMLGKPAYVHLLVNPSAGIILLQESSANNHLSHRVPGSVYGAHNSFELYSKELLQNIFSLINDWSNGHTYRIHGQPNPSINAIKFPLEDYEEVRK